MSPKAIQDIDGFRFYFFSQENNEPPHVLVKKGDGSAKWWLLPEPELVYSIGFKAGEERKVKALIKKHGHEILKAWEAHFNRYVRQGHGPDRDLDPPRRSADH